MSLKAILLLCLLSLEGCAPPSIAAMRPTDPSNATPGLISSIPEPTRTFTASPGALPGATRTPTPTATAASYEDLGQEASGQVYLQNVPMLDQTNYSSCGEAAFAMGWNYRHPELRLEVADVEAAGVKLGVYFPASLAKPHGYMGTSPAGMEAIGNYYAGLHRFAPPTIGIIDLDYGDAFAQLEAKGLLYSQLSAGNPVIIDATDLIGRPSKTINDSHFVVITGMDFDTDLVRYNDPLIHLGMSGKYSGADRLAGWSRIWASWSANRDIDPGLSGHPGRGWYMIVH